MVTAGVYYWAAVTEHGRLYTWGKGCQEDASPAGLDHDNMQHQLVPTFVVPHLLQGARIGRCQKLLPPIALACVMVSAAPTSAPAGGNRKRSRRLEGKTPTPTTGISTGCAYVTMPGELVQWVVTARASWPDGKAGDLEGVV